MAVKSKTLKLDVKRKFDSESVGTKCARKHDAEAAVRREEEGHFAFPSYGPEFTGSLHFHQLMGGHI